MRLKHFFIVMSIVLIPVFVLSQRMTPLIINHRCMNIAQIPDSAIIQAKTDLHIAYGHTSHGSQIITGMTGLVGFMNGLNYPQNLYAHNNGGTGGALDLRDQPFSGASDLGNPDRTAWAAATRHYLDANPIVNVIVWSWCGQVDGTETDVNLYLGLMNQLEIDYPDVRFVYMTGHLTGTGVSGNVNVRNTQIREYCQQNNKILYDFADIESYDPDTLTHYMPLMANDNCDYDSDGNGSRESNWAILWQNAHVENVDWYSCSSAHSQSLNANQKAYAAWWLWARLAGWEGPYSIVDPTPPSIPQNLSASDISQTQIDLSWDSSVDAESGVAGYHVYRDGNYIGQSIDSHYPDTSLLPGTTYSYAVSAVNGASVESAQSSPPLQATTLADIKAPSIPDNLYVNAVSSTQIDLSWSASTDNVGVAGYRVYQDGAALSQTTISTNYSVTDLSPGTQYSFSVSAFDAKGNESSQSQSEMATTLTPSQTQYTLRLETADSEVVDAFLSPTNPNANYGDDGWTEDGSDRFLIQFNLPESLMYKNIIDAQVYFYVWSQSNYADNQYVNCYCVISPWSENHTTWNDTKTGTSWASPGGDYDRLIGQIEHQEGDENWNHTYYPPLDITTQLQRWVNGTDPNYGFIMINEGSTTICFKASEYSNHPYLDITYSDTSMNGTSADNQAWVEPFTFQLCQNFPNPFNPKTTIQYFLPERTYLQLVVYELSGKLIDVLQEGEQEAGYYSREWDTSHLPSGIYFYVLKGQKYQAMRKCLLVK